VVGVRRTLRVDVEHDKRVKPVKKRNALYGFQCVVEVIRLRRRGGGLTTVDVDIAMMASEGVELLLERLNDKRETFVRRVVSGHIVIRKSTGKAATEP